MGRKSDITIIGGLERRLDGPEKPVAAIRQPEPAPAPVPTRKPTKRDGLKFVGFYTSEDQTEKLRRLAFETRRQNQDLMREALDLLFKKHGQ